VDVMQSTYWMYYAKGGAMLIVAAMLLAALAWVGWKTVVWTWFEVVACGVLVVRLCVLVCVGIVLYETGILSFFLNAPFVKPWADRLASMATDALRRTVIDALHTKDT
jgi:hypothetical protein